MADVADSGRDGGERWPASGDDDRAQLVLVGGVVVAFALVALVLLLNTALFTENIATRGLGPGPDDAEDHATFVERSTDRIIRHEERIEYDSWTNAEENATRNVRLVNTTVRAQQFQQHGAIATVNLTGVQRGAVLIQDVNESFESVNDEADWTLAEETSGIRNFSMTVDADETDTKGDPGNFTVVMNGSSGGQWTAAVYENNNDNVEVHANGKTCQSTEPIATINWTAGNLSDCSVPFAVDASTGDPLESPYDLTFRNGSSASGTYHLVARDQTSDDEISTGNFEAAGSGGTPRQYPAVYSVNLTAIYEDSTVEYDTHIRVAPGESNRTRPAS